MKYPYTYIDQAVRMLKALVASYIVTGLLLLLTAGLLYRFELSEGKVRIMIIDLYFILLCWWILKWENDEKQEVSLGNSCGAPVFWNHAARLPCREPTA